MSYTVPMKGFVLCSKVSKILAITISLVLFSTLSSFAKHVHVKSSHHKSEHLNKKGQFNKLSPDLTAEQLRIDNQQTKSVETVPAPTPTPAILNFTITDARCKQFLPTNPNDSPFWVVTFEIKNNDKVDIPLPTV
jgi:hypothetical protein